MKKILGLDLGTNSIGWALVNHNFEKKKGQIIGTGSRIIPMSQKALSEYGDGVSKSQTADRTFSRGTRRLYQRKNLRRERLHRVLNILGFLPPHYADAIDFNKRYGQFKKGTEVKLSYKKLDNKTGKSNYQFLFADSFNEMITAFNKKGHKGPPPDWTIYFLRQKALSQKISKEELAWILLNFNNKRGYYQLRGEEEEDKNKRYVKLKVKSVEDTGENIKGNKLYKVVFDNGWPYDDLITKTEEWVGRTKEFIATIKTLKNGDKKYSYKAVDSEKDWLAIKTKTEQEISQSGQTVGQYIYNNLLSNPYQKIKGNLVRTIERNLYKEELEAILNEQTKHHPDLDINNKTGQKAYSACINELYSKNIAHQNFLKNKGFVHLLLNDIIYYQRPLKSKKSTIGGCQFEHRTYKNDDSEEVKVAVKAIPKSHPLFQEFRLWQFIHNLRIIDKEKEVHSKNKEDADVTNHFLTNEDDLVDLFDALNERKEIEEKHIISYFIKKKLILKTDKEKYKWNYVEDKKYPANETRYEILSRLKKTKGVPANFLTKEKEYRLWHIIYSVKDKQEFGKALEKYASKNNLDKESFVQAFKNISPYTNSYSSYSQKALNKLLPLIRTGKHWSSDNINTKTIERIEKLINGEADSNISNRVREKAIILNKLNDFKGLPVWLASYIVYNRHSESSDGSYWKSPESINEFLKTFKQHSLRNPIVEQIVTETLRTIKDIWNYYGDGKEGFFDAIHLELGRQMKNSAAKRKDITSKTRANQNKNQRIIKILEELKNDNKISGDIRSFSPSHQEKLKLFEEGVSLNPLTSYDKISEDEIFKIQKSSTPSKSEIIKYKLWLEQGYISPYTGKVISLSKLFTTDYQVEHIIPQSRYFDNSLSNKVICESAVNQDKGQMTAYEYLLRKGGELIDGHELFRIDEYEKHCNHYFKNNRSKLTKLLSEEIPEGFINRQLNDSRYLSKFIKGLLSNIVREKDEGEPTPKKLITLSGAITNKLKNDWGLNDKWNEIIAPRFKRMNYITKSEDFGAWDKKINAFRIQVPEENRLRFDKKRIDHRHHAMDAIVIACATKDHINYLNSINSERENHALKSKLLHVNDHGHFTKHFTLPWMGFAEEAKQILELTIVNFKQNLRVINKTNNKTWQWVETDGQLKKKLVNQKGVNWAIRKPLHKETVAGLVSFMPASKGQQVTANRIPLGELSSKKMLEKIPDEGLKKILRKHSERYKDENGKINFEDAFSQAGIEDLNKNIVELNNGKNHFPILSVRQAEKGRKFIVGDTGNNVKKYVETATGTNLFFAIYIDKITSKKAFETIPFNEAIEHQKLSSHLPKAEQTPIQPNPTKGEYLFCLSPHDLVFVPSNDEIDNPRLVNITKLSKDQVIRIYKMVSCTGSECHFIPNASATEIIKNENGTNSKSERIQSGLFSNKITDKDGKDSMIKKRCWKLEVDRIGNIIKIIK